MSSRSIGPPALKSAQEVALSVFLRYPVPQPNAVGMRPREASSVARVGSGTETARSRPARKTCVAPGRLRLIEGLGSVWLEVKDLERSLAFYCDGLRFDLDSRDDGQTATAVLHAGDLTVVLAQRTRPRRASVPMVLTMEVSAVDAYHDALVARGVHASAPTDGDAGCPRSFTVRDPDGVTWRFEQSLA
jgi:uncharacterized glyoxalase superfamily protein PhnB